MFSDPVTGETYSSDGRGVEIHNGVIFLLDDSGDVQHEITLTEEITDQLLAEQKFSAPQLNSINTLTNQAAYKLTHNLLNLVLGEFAYDQVAEICKEDWEASEPYSNTPTYANPGPISILQDGVDEEGNINNCANELTTVTAQATKTITGASFGYETSWTVTACKETLQYNIYLANSVDDRLEIDSGITEEGDISSETKTFSNPKSYEQICVQVSDPSIGNNGYVCFDVI